MQVDTGASYTHISYLVFEKNLHFKKKWVGTSLVQSAEKQRKVIFPLIYGPVFYINGHSVTLPLISVGSTNLLGLDALTSFGMNIDLSNLTMCASFDGNDDKEEPFISYDEMMDEVRRQQRTLDEEASLGHIGSIIGIDLGVLSSIVGLEMLDVSTSKTTANGWKLAILDANILDFMTDQHYQYLVSNNIGFDAFYKFKGYGDILHLALTSQGSPFTKAEAAALILYMQSK